MGPVDIKGMRLADKEGIVGRCVESRKSIIVDDVSRNRDFFKFVDKQSGFETRSVLCVPLCVGEDVLGVLEDYLNVNAGEEFATMYCETTALYTDSRCEEIRGLAKAFIKEAEGFI